MCVCVCTYDKEILASTQAIQIKCIVGPDAQTRKFCNKNLEKCYRFSSIACKRRPELL